MAPPPLFPAQLRTAEKMKQCLRHWQSGHLDWGGRLWLSDKLVPTGRRPSGGVTILDLEQAPVAFSPNPIDVVQFYIPRAAQPSGYQSTDKDKIADPLRAGPSFITRDAGHCRLGGKPKGSKRQIPSLANRQERLDLFTRNSRIFP